MEKKNTTKSTPSRSFVIRLLIIGALVSMTVVACGHHGDRFSPKMVQRLVLGHVDDVLDEIDATDAQRATFERTAQEILNDALAMRKSHKAHHKMVLQALSKPTVDREALKVHIQDKFDRMEDFVLRSMNKALDAYETLDAGQRKIVLEKLANHMEKH